MAKKKKVVRKRAVKKKPVAHAKQMSTRQIANRLYELCKQGKYQQCYKELYSPNVRSIEPDGELCEGFAEMAEKGKEWNANIKKVHSTTIGKPVVAGNRFALPMGMNITYVGAPGPVDFNEICMYIVKDGKVVQEEFFYDAP